MAPCWDLANDMLIGWQNSFSSSLLCSLKCCPLHWLPQLCALLMLNFLLTSVLLPFSDLFHLLFSLPWTSFLLFAQLGPYHLSVVKGQFFGKVFFGFLHFLYSLYSWSQPFCFHHNTLLFVIIFLICFYSVFPIWISASSGWECLGCSHSFTPSTHHGAWYISSTKKVIGLSWWFSGKESACQCRRCGFDLWVGKIPWRRKQQPTPVFLPGEFHGQRSLVGYSSWSHKS